MPNRRYFSTPVVGFTPLYINNALTDRLAKASKCGTPIVYVKDESYNPTGSHKDRVAGALVEMAVEKGYKDVIFVGITDGGLGKSMGYMAKSVPCKIRF